MSLNRGSSESNVPRGSNHRSSWDNDEEEEDDFNSPLLPVSHKRECSTSSSSSAGSGSEGSIKNFKSRRSTRIKREHRLSQLFKLATCFFLSLTALVGFGTCGWVGWYMYGLHNAYAQSVFSPPLEPLPKPVEHLVPSFSPTRLLSNVQDELDQRLLSLSLPPSTLPCDELSSPSFDGNSTFSARYSSLPLSGPYLLALNLYNSQEVLPTLSKTLLTISDFLGRQNVHVSIFENGSTDNTTLALAHLAAALSTLGVQHTIVSDSRPTPWAMVDRIDQLAVYRNVALKPVTEGLHGREFEDVLFINDVFAGPVDALELLWQRREQEADAACALDWRGTKGFLSRWGAGSVKMYDSWVTRSINGNMLRNRLDVWSEGRHGVKELFDQSGEEASRERLKRGLPIPVYSCWNGILAISAEPFRTTGINPRINDRIGPFTESKTEISSLQTSLKPTEFRSALTSVGECAASECKTLARDFWRRGYNRWLIVPTIHVTYAQSVYSHPHLLNIVDQAQKFLTSSESTSTISSLLSPKIDWSLPEWSAPQTVVCWQWARGWHIDLPGWRSSLEQAWR